MLNRRVADLIAQDEQDLVDLCLELGNFPSPHAKERPIADHIAAWLRHVGIEAWLQPITDDSANVVGFLPGAGGGSSLIMDAHLDAGPELPANLPERVRRIHQAWVEDGVIYGFAVANDKGQMAAFMIAARALVKAGVKLKGDLYLAGVAFETGAPSVGDNHGINA